MIFRVYTAHWCTVNKLVNECVNNAVYDVNKFHFCYYYNYLLL